MAATVLSELDGIARECDHYDYGLPVGMDDFGDRLLAVVVRAIVAERERAAKIAQGPWKEGDVGYMPEVCLPIAAAIRARAEGA